jgi:hypothetical protein
MDKKLILELVNHNVYYVKTDVVNYYITIPKNTDSTGICIELKNKMGNYDLELNDEVWVMENIKNVFSYIDNYNITLVLPVLKEEQISILEKIDESKFEQIDRILGYTINSSYNVLKSENKRISNQIILVNNDRYKSFIIWFITRYKDRVICKNLLELIQIFNANATSYKKLETPLMNFVVGSYNTEVDAPKVEVKEISTEEVETPHKEMEVSYGYASYWILAVVTLVVSAAVAFIAFTMK